MSYCRFSSDDYRCDVYVYEDINGGWLTHVAGARHTLTDDQLPPPVTLSKPFTEDEFLAWYRRNEEVGRLIDNTERRPIGLPHDGETFNDPTPGACADRLLGLRALGYNVPQYAIDALLSEAAS